MGCSSELMALMADIIETARLRYNNLIDELLLVAHSIHLERQLYTLRQHCSHAPLTIGESSQMSDWITSLSTQPGVSARSKILVLTAEARRQALLVLLHVSVNGLPVFRAEVRLRVANCLLCLSSVSRLMDAADAPLWGMSPVIWPLFVAGASATMEEQRLQVVEMFEKLKMSKCLGVSLQVLPERAHSS